MSIILFLFGSIIWFWVAYGLSLALFGAFKAGVAETPIVKYHFKNQPFLFFVTVLVQVIFWVVLVLGWLHGLWDFVTK